MQNSKVKKKFIRTFYNHNTAARARLMVKYAWVYNYIPAWASKINRVDSKYLLELFSGVPIIIQHPLPFAVVKV